MTTGGRGISQQGTVLQSGTGAQNETIEQEFRDRGVIVTEFAGVDKTGATDSTTGITNAIAALGSAGGTILFPPGTFKTTSAIAIPANVKLLGAGVAESWNGAGSGKGTIISNTVNGNTFTITNVSNVTIEGFSFEGSTSTGAHVLVDGGAGAASNIFLTRNTFLGKDNALKYSNIVFQIHATGNVMSAQNLDGVFVDASGSSGDTSLYFVKNWVRGSGAKGININGSQGTVNLVIDQCQVSNLSANNSSAILLNNVSGASVTNNDIESITGTGSANGIFLAGSSAVEVHGNTLLDVRGNAPIYGSTLFRSHIGTNRILKGSAGSSFAIVLDSGSFDNIVTDQSTDYTVPGSVVIDSGTNNIILLHGLVNTRALTTTRTALAYSASIATDASLGNSFTITATDGSAFAIANPTHLTAGQRLLYTIRNTSGGALGTTTWGTTFKVAAPTALTIATGNSLSIEFLYDGTNLIEVFRTPVVVPN